MAQAFIGLGSNLGDREANLRAAIEALPESDGIEVVAVSGFHETAPVGGPPQPDYLNAAVELRATLSPSDLLDRLLAIESRLGRVRLEHWGPRVIDLDLLLYGNRIIDLPHLKVPHPFMHQRRFVLAPLAEIAPDAVHPVLDKSIKELLGSPDLPPDRAEP